MTASTQRIFVTSAPAPGGATFPTFLVHPRVRDKFIAEEVERRHGRQEGGEPHEWKAYDADARGVVIETESLNG